MNKCDLANGQEWIRNSVSTKFDLLDAERFRPVYVSAQTGEGLDTLEATLIQPASTNTVSNPEYTIDDVTYQDTNNGVVVANARHKQALVCRVRQFAGSGSHDARRVCPVTSSP